MTIPESEIWEASFLIGMTTDFKHGAIKPGSPEWEGLPEPFKSDLHSAKLVSLTDTFDEEGQQVYGPSWAVITLTKAAQERGLSLADFWQKLEEQLARQSDDDPTVDLDWLSRSLRRGED